MLHHVMLGICLACLALAQWGALDLGMHIPQRETVRLYTAGLLSLGGFLLLTGGLLTYSEMSRRLDRLPFIWRNSRLVILGVAVLGIIYPLLAGRFGMAFVGIVAVGVFALAVEARKRLVTDESGQRVDASLERVSSLVKELDRQIPEDLEGAIDDTDFRTPRPFLVPPRTPLK